MGFAGKPTAQVHDQEVARWRDLIRKQTESMHRSRALLLATAAMRGIAAFVEATFGLRELLAIIDQIKLDLEVT